MQRTTAHRQCTRSPPSSLSPVTRAVQALKWGNNITTRSRSDSEVVGYLYEKFGVDTAGMLDGKFAFILFDKPNGRVYAARDHMGSALLGLERE